MTIDRMLNRKTLLICGLLLAAACPPLFLGADREVALWAGEVEVLRGPLFRLVTQFGDALYPIVLAVLVLLLAKTAWSKGAHPLACWIRKNRQFFKFLLLNVVISGLLVDLLKILFGRSRPKLLFASGDYGFHFLQFSAVRWSFPSGHSNTALVIALTLSLFYKRWGLLAFVPALMTCFSRIALLKHYPSDVLAGAFVALLTTVLLKDRFFADQSVH